MFSKRELERLRQEGLKTLEELNEQPSGHCYEANGTPVTCVHCQHHQFDKSKALVNSRGMTFFDLDWLDESATVLICRQCGYIHWFAKEVTAVPCLDE